MAGWRINCVGGPGTVVLVDTTGIHRATPNRQGVRGVVAVYYDAATRAKQPTFFNLPVPSQYARKLRPDQRKRLRLPEHASY